MQFSDIKSFLPEIILILGSIIILIYGIFYSNKENLNKKILYITVISLILSLYFCILNIGQEDFLFNNLLVNNSYTIFFKILAFIGTIVITIISYNYLNDLKIIKPEFFFLIL